MLDVPQIDNTVKREHKDVLQEQVYRQVKWMLEADEESFQHKTDAMFQFATGSAMQANYPWQTLRDAELNMGVLVNRVGLPAGGATVRRAKAIELVPDQARGRLAPILRERFAKEMPIITVPLVVRSTPMIPFSSLAASDADTRDTYSRVRIDILYDETNDYPFCVVGLFRDGCDDPKTEVPLFLAGSASPVESEK